MEGRWLSLVALAVTLSCGDEKSSDGGASNSGDGTADGSSSTANGVTNSSMASGGSASSTGGASSDSSGGAAASSAASGGAGSSGAAGGTDASAGNGSGGASTSSGGSSTLSERYPGDEDILSDDGVLFHDDFEEGWGRWDSPQQDTDYLYIETDSSMAHSGSAYLRSTVTTDDLAQDEYISSASRFDFPERVQQMYWRFYAWFEGVAPNPHHWVRVSAGTESYNSSGLANTVPPGDEGFWFDLDANNDDIFNFYVYWYQMRSGRCNDGTAVDGCEGDQGTTYHYGNVFRPDPQDPFAHDAWTCIEIRAKANTVGSSDGELALWIDDQLVGEYRPGEPTGTWLRDQFHTGGCDFSACTEPMPFEGFDFRSSDEVRFKAIILDAYYERGSSADKKAELESRGLTVSDTQTILYDDVVVATERIGCRVAP